MNWYRDRPRELLRLDAADDDEIWSKEGDRDYMTLPGSLVRAIRRTTDEEGTRDAE